MRRTATIFMCVLIGTIFFFVLRFSVEKTERAECIRWEEESRAYSLYFTTDWQREQCNHYGITLPKGREDSYIH